MEKYYILKQFYPDAEIWVASLGPGDPVYVYDTLAEADEALPSVQLLYPDNKCKVSEPITAVE
jgi:hypothetical protein